MKAKMNTTQRQWKPGIFTLTLLAAAAFLVSDAAANARNSIYWWLAVNNGSSSSDTRQLVREGRQLFRELAPGNIGDFNRAVADALTGSSSTADRNAYIASGLPQRARPSQILRIAMGSAPNYAPYFGRLAVESALLTTTDAIPWRFRRTTDNLRDAQRAAEQSILRGLRTYNPLRNLGAFSGLPSLQLTEGASAIASNVIQGAIDAGTANGTSEANQATVVQQLVYGMVRKSRSASRRNPVTPGGAVTASIAQNAGLGTAQDAGTAPFVNSVVDGIVSGAAQASRKRFAREIVQATAYSLFATYKATGGTREATAADPNDSYLAVIINGDKTIQSYVVDLVMQRGRLRGFDTQASLENAFATGLGAAAAAINTLGGAALTDDPNDPGQFFMYTNGTQSPVTDIKGV